MAQPDLRESFPDLTPIRGGPALFTFNSIGFTVYGARDRHPETGTYVKTYCAVVFFVPVLCLAAYRVAPAERGWYFLGKVPLSGFAMLWNALVALAVLTLGGSIAWQAHTSSPDYRSWQELRRGETALEAGQVATAVDILVPVAHNGRAAATQAHADLLGIAPKILTYPAPGQALTALTRTGELVPAGDVKAAAVAVLDRLAAKDPAQALALLDGLPGPFQPQDLAARRAGLLGKLHAMAPLDPQWAVELALLAEAKPDVDACEALLAPYTAQQLGTGEGARMLGAIRAGQGRQDEAYPLLSAYCRGRLKALHAASDAYEAVLKQINDDAIAELNRGAGGDAWYAKYKAADKAGQEQMVDEYVVRRLKTDPRMTAAEAEVGKQAKVVPVALDLGIVTLQRAQAEQGDARQKSMKDAEEVFLAIRGVAGENDQFHLFYGQVCWWLGKVDDGRKEFDALLEKHQRAPDMLLLVSEALRSLGAVGEARAMAEEAYATAKDDAVRHQAAHQRSLCRRDDEDDALWLSRCDQADPVVVADLTHVRGRLALAQGDRAGAAELLRQSLKLYRGLPQDASSLNNAALAADDLFTATGDQAVFAEANHMMEQAIALDPGDTILQFNLCNRLYIGAVMATVGARVDQDALGMAGDPGVLPYLYADDAGRAALAATLRANPGTVRALAMAERLEVEYSREPRLWSTLSDILEFSDDAAGLARMRDQLRRADLDHGSDAQYFHEFYAGRLDQQMGDARDGRVAALETCMGATASAATQAVAGALIVDAQLSAVAGGGTVDADGMVKMAEDALARAPSSGGRMVLVGALLERAAARRSAAVPAFKDACDHGRRGVTRAIMMVEAMRGDPAVRADPDVARAVEVVAAEADALPKHAGIWEWAVLDAAGDPRAAALGERLRADPIEALDREIEGYLSPYSAEVAMRQYWHARLVGATDPAAVLKPWRERGVALPF